MKLSERSQSTGIRSDGAQNLPVPFDWKRLVVLSALTLFASDVGAQTEKDDKKADGDKVDEAYVRAHYTKFEHDIAMRDGVKLFTAVFAPKDVSEQYPIILKRTPTV